MTRLAVCCQVQMQTNSGTSVYVPDSQAASLLGFEHPVASTQSKAASVIDFEDMHPDDPEDGGWSSGFDDSDDDDLMGGPF